MWAGSHSQKMEMAYAQVLRTLNKCIQINSSFLQNSSVSVDWLFWRATFHEQKGFLFLFWLSFNHLAFNKILCAFYNVWNYNTCLDLQWFLWAQFAKSRASVWLVIIIALASESISQPFKHPRWGFCTSAGYSMLLFTKNPFGEIKP